MGKKKRKHELPGDAELLIELATLDEVEAWVPTVMDHQASVTPDWCELVFTAKRNSDQEWPLSVTMPLRRHDGELMIEVLQSVLHPDTDRGMGIRSLIEDELDAIVDTIQRRVDKGREPMKRDVGIAYGLALALAIMTDPGEPDVDEVRAQAMIRYEERHPSLG